MAPVERQTLVFRLFSNLVPRARQADDRWGATLVPDETVPAGTLSLRNGGEMCGIGCHGVELREHRLLAERGLVESILILLFYLARYHFNGHMHA